MWLTLQIKEGIGKRRIVCFAGPFNKVLLYVLLSEKSISGSAAGFSFNAPQKSSFISIARVSSSCLLNVSSQHFFDWWLVNFASLQVSSWAWMRPPQPSPWQPQTPPARPSESKCWLWPMWGLFHAARTTFTGRFPAFSFFCLLKRFLMETYFGSFSRFIFEQIKKAPKIFCTINVNSWRRTCRKSLKF